MMRDLIQIISSRFPGEALRSGSDAEENSYRFLPTIPNGSSTPNEKEFFWPNLQRLGLGSL
ncbi:hypothetical protein HPB48_002321 [Haemaphysalis longicornis]|uniref:Uncharacterized protein n=1 Tax=Haemaphysalis longicornis TaxID=44386 RepID=A0A9J6GX11_HAELO|nr:hypothetical protein HPB48_002321 [Haemaphysalis longicornis]